MEKLKRAGYFRELDHGHPDGDSLMGSIQTAPQDHETAIVTYLNMGATFAVSPCLIHDVINPEHPVICGLAVRTDGVWEWPSDLDYYVKQYHVKLPDGFVAHMKNNDWEVPPISESDLIRICEE
jgi:hypothetical protein